MVSTKILHSKTFSHIDNNKKSPNQHCRIISEGSCDTEDWSNDADNSFNHLRKKNKKQKNIKTENAILNCNNISQYYCFYSVFQIK